MKQNSCHKRPLTLTATELGGFGEVNVKKLIEGGLRDMNKLLNFNVFFGF